MTPKSLFQRAQMLWTATIGCSLAACSSFQYHRPGSPVEIPAYRRVATNDATQNEAGATPRSALDAQLAGLSQQVAARRQYNDKLREFAATKEQQLAAVLASDRSAGPVVQEFDLRTSINVRLAEIDRASQASQETIDAHKNVLEKAGGDPRAAELRAEINRLSEQQAELLRLRAKLAALPGKLRQ